MILSGLSTRVQASPFQSSDLVEIATQEIANPLSVKIKYNEAKSDGTLSYYLFIKNRTEHDIVTRYSTEILDDRGHSIVAPSISSDFRFSSNSVNQSKVDLNPSLADGYYVFRVRAVSIDQKGNQSNAFDEAFTEVIKGKKTIIDEEEFNALSLINIGVKQPEPKEKN